MLGMYLTGMAIIITFFCVEYLFSVYVQNRNMGGVQDGEGLFMFFFKETVKAWLIFSVAVVLLRIFWMFIPPTL